MIKELCSNCYKETEFLINSVDYDTDVYECTECHEPNHELDDE